MDVRQLETFGERSFLPRLLVSLVRVRCWNVGG